MDAKRGDIGSTSEQYVFEVFERYKADAVTLNPYMGIDTLSPFLSRKDKGSFILCKTSNPSSSEIQNLKVDDKMIFEIVAEKAKDEWNYNGNVCLVVGATFPQELAALRRLVHDIPFLVPRVGTQGGDLSAVVSSGVDSAGYGLIMNLSRYIIYSASSKKYWLGVRRKAMEVRNEINRARDNG